MSNRYMTKKEKEKNMYMNLIIVLLVLAIAIVAGMKITMNKTLSDEELEEIIGANKTESQIQEDIERAQKYQEDPTGTTKDEAIDRVLSSIGKDSEDLNKTYNEDGTVNGESVKTVKQFRTLNEAEVYMGFYLGLHNRLESIDKYELVSISNVGEGTWFQALYQSEDLDEYTDFTLKVSKTTPMEVLLGAFDLENGYKYHDTIDINGQEVNILSKGTIEGDSNLAYFSTKNGKKYVLNCGGGMLRENMELILNELVINLMSMDDWVW